MPHFDNAELRYLVLKRGEDRKVVVVSDHVKLEDAQEEAHKVRGHFVRVGARDVTGTWRIM